jgi:hypothetical protein
MYDSDVAQSLLILLLLGQRGSIPSFNSSSAGTRKCTDACASTRRTKIG